MHTNPFVLHTTEQIKRKTHFRFRLRPSSSAREEILLFLCSFTSLHFFPFKITILLHTITLAAFHTQKRERAREHEEDAVQNFYAKFQRPNTLPNLIQKCLRLKRSQRRRRRRGKSWTPLRCSPFSAFTSSPISRSSSSRFS